MKQRKIDIEKVIREIEEYKRQIRNSNFDKESVDCLQEFIRKDVVIQIIKNNIKESEETDYSKKYHNLQEKYLELSEKYYNLKDGEDDKIEAECRICIFEEYWQCKKHAPTKMDEFDNAIFPNINPTDWCGDFKSKK